MKTFVALFAFIAVASAAVAPFHQPAHVAHHAVHHPVVAGNDAVAETLRSESVVNPDSFQYNYETSNGISASASGQLKQFNKDEQAVVEQGQFAYTSPDGTPIQLTYVANENGFQPQGDHLPVAPAIPEAIVRALEWIASHPPAKQ